MAIEIKELTIKVDVKDNDNGTKVSQRSISEFSKQQIVKECVELVMERLETRFDR